MDESFDIFEQVDGRIEWWLVSESKWCGCGGGWWWLVVGGGWWWWLSLTFVFDLLFLIFSFHIYFVISVNNQTTWLNNPFCSFVVKGQATAVSIEITQPRTQNYPVGVAIFKGIHPMDNVASRIVGGKPWHQNQLSIQLDGEGQEYTIMAQTFAAGSIGEFEIRLLSDGVVEMLQGLTK